ncbi:hypothetical protein ACFVT5_05255 [Streptomyces sp. NPDC058001]|uniref:hypothetical protein n=1 Tax=Streptomyces sp. NPDC058001 TaxID=3346300 RepID=UPI0036E8D19F
MTGEQPYDDPLMLALTDEPLPDAARDDPETLAAHRAAVADIAELHVKIRQLGDTLAARETAPAPTPAPALTPRPVPARPRRRVRIALGALVTACALAVFGGFGWLVVQGGGMGANDTSAASKGDAKDVAPEGGQRDQGQNGQGDLGDLSPEGYVACARLIVEGEVTRVEPLAGGDQDRITLTVDHYYKPSEGDKVVTFVMDRAVDPRLRIGETALIGIPHGSGMPDIWATGADIPAQRAWIKEALPGSSALTC